MALITVCQNRGIHLPEAGLWLDPQFSVERAFVSHAHSDHVGRHELTICTELTRLLMESRLGASPRRDFVTLPLREPFDFGNFELALLPAGHVVGSAMLHITRKHDGASLLYTGDFKLRQGFTTERAELRPADTLIMETTFGLPRYRFPPVDEVAAAMRKFVGETLGAGGIPVLLGYSLGKAQEILAAIARSPHPVMAYESITKITDLLRPHLASLPPCRALDAAGFEGHALVMPPHAARLPDWADMKPLRTAMVSGWALDPSAKYRFQVDEAFPLSDHADYPELLETVEKVRPRLVYTVHGYTREFAADLRRRGWDARALGRVEQLEMML